MIEITQSNTNNFIIFLLEGDLDLFSSDELKTRVLNTIAESKKGLVFDMKEVNYLDSMGVGSLLFTFSETKKFQKKFCLIHLQGTPRKVIQLTKLDRYFPIFSSPEEVEQHMQ